MCSVQCLILFIVLNFEPKKIHNFVKLEYLAKRRLLKIELFGT